MSAALLSDLDKLAVNAVLEYRAQEARRLTVTPAMLAAGRAAFKSKRRLLDDLYSFYECDLDATLRHIFREMARAAE